MLSNLNSNLAVTLGYLNPASNNSALVYKWIRCIEFLSNVNLKFLALSEMKEKYDFWISYCLLRALPTEWKSAQRVKASEYGEPQKCETSLKLFSTKEAYSTTLEKSFSAPTAEGRS